MAPVDKRSGKVVVVSHCILNVHSLEDNLAFYPGLEEEVVEILIKSGVGIYQIPCPEIELSSIFRKALPKEAYDHPKIREVYRNLSQKLAKNLKEYAKKGYKILAVLGAEGSPTCGIDRVGRWKKDTHGQKVFPRDVEFIRGRGVFMEEFMGALDKLGISPEWIGIPGKSIRSLEPESFQKTLLKIEAVLQTPE
jgi:predicted secreted protein